MPPLDKAGRLYAGQPIESKTGRRTLAVGDPRLLRENGQSDDIDLLAFYVTPGVPTGIKRGSVLGTVIEPSVMFTKLCVDQAVQALEGKKNVDAAPALSMVDKSLDRIMGPVQRVSAERLETNFRVD